MAPRSRDSASPLDTVLYDHGCQWRSDGVPIAAYKGHLDVLKWVTQHRLRYDHRDEAEEAGNVDIVEYLDPL